MAEILGHISLKVLDDLGVVASAPYYFEFPDGVNLADINTAVQAFVTDTDAITDGQILGIELVMSVPLPGGVKTAPVAGAEIERGGLFNFLQEDIKYKFGVLVPAFKKSLIVNGKINLAATAVQTWINLFPTIGGDAVPITTAGRLITFFSDALITFRKHRKAENRRSFEE